ncbi:MAG: four helix bundle protein, partial [Oscillospiraceae bacterium]|nr:four helix bundle protein [Oscillospiraceae bacterium]
EYWLHILQKSDYLDEQQAGSLLNDCLEIKRILISSVNTAKSGAENNN